MSGTEQNIEKNQATNIDLSSSSMWARVAAIEARINENNSADTTEQSENTVASSVPLKETDTSTVVDSSLQRKEKEPSTQLPDTALELDDTIGSCVTAKDAAASCEKDEVEDDSDVSLQRPCIKVHYYHSNLELFVLDVINLCQNDPYFGLQECDIVEMIRTHGLGNGDIVTQAKWNLKQLIQKGIVRYVNGGYRFLGYFAALTSARTQEERDREWDRLSKLDGPMPTPTPTPGRTQARAKRADRVADKAAPYKRP